MVEREQMAEAPGDVVVCAGSISTHSQSSHAHVARGVEPQTTSEDVDAADLVRRDLDTEFGAQIGQCRRDRIGADLDQRLPCGGILRMIVPDRRERCARP